jgi:hypothetical protein
MFIKHVGKQGDRKVAIVFREVPGEEHMSLVVYPDVLKTELHDAIIKVIETPEGQAAENLGDALFRNLFPDGRPMLTALHAEGMIKKVRSETIIVTPTPSTSVRLDELNNILREMAQGEQAIKKLQELDKNAGMTGKVRPRDDFGREIGAPTDNAYKNLAGSSTNNGALDDSALANNFRQQAEKMAAEAKGLLAESARLMKEAAAMSGSTPESSAPKKRGRPSKQAVADASNT